MSEENIKKFTEEELGVTLPQDYTKQLYMVVCKDNYNREITDERIVATNLEYESEAIAMVTGLNASQPIDGENYYVVEPA